MAGKGGAGQGRAGQGRAGQGRADLYLGSLCLYLEFWALCLGWGGRGGKEEERFPYPVLSVSLIWLLSEVFTPSRLATSG